MLPFTRFKKIAIKNQNKIYEVFFAQGRLVSGRLLTKSVNLRLAGSVGGKLRTIQVMVSIVTIIIYHSRTFRDRFPSCLGY